jgi:putative transposase
MGLEPIRMALPKHVLAYSARAYKQVELVWDRASRRCHWHVTLEDGAEPAPAPGNTIIAVDLGAIHPPALTEGTEAVVVTARRLRAARQYTVERMAAMQTKLAGKQQGPRRWTQRHARTHRVLAQQQKRTRDIEHTGSRAGVDDAVERTAGPSARGDVRPSADGKRPGARSQEPGARSQQKMGRWSPGKVRQSITYKAKAAGIALELIDEHDTSTTCPRSAHQSTPTGRVYRCPRCGFVAHRDAVGSVTSRSRTVYGELARILPPPLAVTTYRYPA